MSALDRISALPTHPIGGYEWECDECHYHFVGHACHITGEVATEDGSMDSKCRPSQHDDLIDRNDVLAILKEEAV